MCFQVLVTDVSKHKRCFYSLKSVWLPSNVEQPTQVLKSLSTFLCLRCYKQPRSMMTMAIVESTAAVNQDIRFKELSGPALKIYAKSFAKSTQPTMNFCQKYQLWISFGRGANFYPQCIRNALGFSDLVRADSCFSLDFLHQWNTNTNANEDPFQTL